MPKFKKGCIPWHKGKHIQTNTGRTHFKKGYIPWNKGKKFNKETREKMSIAKKGKSGNQTNHWKNGIFENYAGYIYIYQPNHPFAIQIGYIRRSRFTMEKYLGRYLKPQEVVHHINGIKNDDRIENLQLFANRSKHVKFHKLNN